jgi:N-acetyl-gamma-glutamyl-phosphate/LysW-gamma-L-alpha-aminoadipyl-6-phosphate reductase
MIRVSIVGGSGYVGGELLRLLLRHPHVDINQVTSERLAGKPVTSTHPHLRGHTDLVYTSQSQLSDCDLLILALPHGSAATRITAYAELAPRIIDCSADFRLRDPDAYQRWYGEAHANPAWLERFVYGLPELNRDAIRIATHVSGVGCNATATTLALLPLVRAGILAPHDVVISDVKVGSSEGGAQSNDGSHHPERSGVVRTFAATGHRHTAEVIQATGLTNVHLSITSVELVRGAVATVHCLPQQVVDEKALWRAYRGCYREEPFVRIVRERGGIHRLPEPKLLSGTNYADVGFDIDPQSGRIVSICAIDNLMKGAAGSALQCLNLMCGFPEHTALDQIGLHPS